MSKKANANNHANQLNSNNPAYWNSRGLAGKPAPATGGTEAAASTQPALTPPKKEG